MNEAPEEILTEGFPEWMGTSIFQWLAPIIHAVNSKDRNFLSNDVERHAMKPPSVT
jgi:hypothetical protein